MAPRLVNPTPHKPTIYAPMQLPTMTVRTPPTRDPGLNSRINQNTPAAPSIGNQTPARPLGSMTNTVNQVRK